MRSRGFSLVELTFAIGFIVVSVLSLFGMLSSSMQVAAVTQERAKALRVAQNVLEQLRTQTTVRSFSDGFAGVTSRTFDVKVGDTQLRPQKDDPDQRVGFVWFPGDDSTLVSAEDARRIKANPKRSLLLPWPSDSAGSTRAGTWTPTSVTTNVLGQLREDVALAVLGLPRDLNGNGRIDDPTSSPDGWDAASSAILLPVVVVVEWRGVVGDSRLQLATTLGTR
jgi:type II secretory pathway pseudopilin PulG